MSEWFNVFLKWLPRGFFSRLKRKGEKSGKEICLLVASGERRAVEIRERESRDESVREMVCLTKRWDERMASRRVPGRSGGCFSLCPSSNDSLPNTHRAIRQTNERQVAAFSPSLRFHSI